MHKNSQGLTLILTIAIKYVIIFSYKSLLGVDYMADTKLTIIGMSGSGKTCYLLGMFYKMTGRLKGYNLHTDDDTHTELTHRYEVLNDESKRQGRFPKPTDMPEKFIFNLQYGYQDILSFEWADYPGGYLKEKNDGDVEGYTDVKNSIINSSTLFICIDGSLLYGDDTEEKIERVRDNCSNTINHFFSEYRQENGILPPTAFIITKYDECAKDTNLDELCEIVEEAFSGFFTEIIGAKNITTIIPVTLGKNIKYEEYAGNLKPENIHLPIFMGIWFALRDYVKNLGNENNIINKQINDLMQSLSSSFSQNKNEIERQTKEIETIQSSIKAEQGKWFGGNKKHIRELLDKITDLNNKITKLQNEARGKDASAAAEQTRLTTALQNNVFQLNVAIEKSSKLFDELDKKLPVVYLNGEKTTFKLIAELLDEGE